MFSLAGRKVHVSSRTTASGFGWSANIASTDWTSGARIAVNVCARRPGTSIEIEIPADWLTDLKRVTTKAARFYPLPVILNNQRLPQEAFLDGALHVEKFDGLVIGVFHAQDRFGAGNDALNFHGLTVNHKLPTVTGVDCQIGWFARVDIVDCPALQLTLPARKEVVACDFLARLEDAVRAAIVRTIAGRTGHRLPYTDWEEARALGVELPVATTGLRPFVPTTLDGSIAWGSTRPAMHGDGLVLVGHHDAAYEQTLSRALVLSGHRLRDRLVRSEATFAGYGWYDRLATVETLRFVVQQGDAVHVVGEDVEDGLTLEDPRVDAIAVELTVLGHCLPEVYQLNTDLLLLPNDEHDLDQAPISVVPNLAAATVTPLSPAILAAYLDAAYFCASDDRDCDSFDTQLRAWQDDSLHRAATLLEGQDAATARAIEAAFRRHIAWMVPSGSRLAVSFAEPAFDIVITPMPALAPQPEA